MERRSKNRFIRVWVMMVVLALALALASAAVAQDATPAQDAPAAATAGTLTLGVTTTPAGGQAFWLTAVSFQGSWGRFGKGNGQYRQPRDIDQDAAGNLYVSDHRNSRVQKLSSTGTFLASIGQAGRGAHKLLRPNAIAVSGNLLFVANTENHRITVFNTTNGAFVREWGGKGTADGKFDMPNGVAVGPDNNIYVTDTFNHRIQVFTQEGVFLRKWGSLGSGDDQMRFPAHLDFDSAGNIYVADSNNNRIVVTDANGVFQRKFGVSGTNPGQFRIPVGVEVGSDGYLYVAEAFGNRIQKLTTSGDFIAYWSEVAGGAAISRPNGLLVTSDRLYATDLDASRIQIYMQISGTLNDGGQQALPLPAGTYNVTQAPKTGWTFDGATCSGGSPTAIPWGARLTLADGASVNCAFANHQ